MAVCKWRDYFLPVLMYPKVHSAPGLKSHHFRHATNGISSDLSALLAGRCSKIGNFLHERVAQSRFNLYRDEGSAPCSLNWR
ncbi:hypothetical protein FIB18_17425 [Brucella pecoris]|uniref:Uncharacterized protein n=1 Tax=Brucella pecoris TaxID=867683 RepID=A0A5C5CFS3_9HYPH|nr:hypothetical protein FIB18_17425 [Brucella pecoris]